MRKELRASLLRCLSSYWQGLCLKPYLVLNAQGLNSCRVISLNDVVFWVGYRLLSWDFAYTRILALAKKGAERVL